MENSNAMDGLASSTPTTRSALVTSSREPVPQSLRTQAKGLSIAKTNAKWYAQIGAQPNRWMETKAFWLRSAAHYRDPFWRDVHGEMHALRQIRKANRNLIRFCLQVA